MGLGLYLARGSLGFYLVLLLPASSCNALVVRCFFFVLLDFLQVWGLALLASRAQGQPQSYLHTPLSSPTGALSPFGMAFKKL